jgi:16S rRNA processing protein RimM
MSTPKRVLLGHICGLHGVCGWVKVFSVTAPPANILNYSPWQIGQGGQWRTLDVLSGRVQGKSIVAQLATYDDRDAAAQLLGAEIAVYREQLPILDKGDYYWTDLIGLTVINQQGITLGQVSYLLETGANDVLVVQGDRERLIPFLHDQVVLMIDFERGVVSVDWDAEFSF